MKVAKTLIESMPCKGDFHAEEMREWNLYLHLQLYINRTGQNSLVYMELVTMIQFGISSV